MQQLQQERHAKLIIIPIYSRHKRQQRGNFSQASLRFLSTGGFYIDQNSHPQYTNTGVCVWEGGGGGRIIEIFVISPALAPIKTPFEGITKSDCVKIRYVGPSGSDRGELCAHLAVCCSTSSQRVLLFLLS